MDQVDEAAERFARTDRQVEGRGLGAERGAQRVQCVGRLGVLAVALVDEEAGRPTAGPPQRHGALQPRFDTRRGVHHEERPVGSGEALDHFRDEVGIAGRVEQGDARVLVVE